MIVLGYKKFNSKDGSRSFCQLFYSDSFTDKDIKYSDCGGSHCAMMWIPDKLHSKVSVDCVGKKLLPSFDFVGGKAYLTDISFKQNRKVVIIC